MPATSLNFAPIVVTQVGQSYSLYQALRKRNADLEKVEDLMGRIAGAIIHAYQSDEDFDTVFSNIAAEAGVAATGSLFRQFVVPEKVAEWETAYIAEHPEASDDELITLEPMQSPAEYRRRRLAENA